MNVADVLTIGILGLVVCVAGYNFLGAKQSEPANDLVDPNQSDLMHRELTTVVQASDLRAPSPRPEYI